MQSNKHARFYFDLQPAPHLWDICRDYLGQHTILVRSFAMDIAFAMNIAILKSHTLTFGYLFLHAEDRLFIILVVYRGE